MGFGVALGAGARRRFSLPHAFCLMGEQQYLLGTSAIHLAGGCRTQVEVYQAPEGPALSFDGASLDRRGNRTEDLAGQLKDCWQERMATGGPSAGIEDLGVSIHFDDVLEPCPPQILVESPAVGAALTVVALLEEGRLSSLGETEVAELAAHLLRMSDSDKENPYRHYGPALTSLTGGVVCVGPEEPRLNVQQLVPPESLLLALLPGLEGQTRGVDHDREAARAVESALDESNDVMQRGDSGFSELFAMDGQVLDERQTTMLYGLLRVRQMTEEFLEHLGEPFVDNDRLAEICDEESEILTDYFGFPAEPFASLRQRAAEAGALGLKLSWAFGGYPAGLILAPGRREEVREQLSDQFPEAGFIPLDMDPAGLRWEKGPRD